MAEGEINSIALNDDCGASLQFVNSVFDFVSQRIDSDNKYRTDIIRRNSELILEEDRNKDKQRERKFQRKMLEENNRHKELMKFYNTQEKIARINAQEQILEKLIDASTFAFTKKMDFLEAQRCGAQEFYNFQLQSINQFISKLELERCSAEKNISKYVSLSNLIMSYTNAVSEIDKKYNELQNTLTCEIDKCNIQALHCCDSLKALENH